MNLECEIVRAAQLIQRSRHMIAFTGAGHSTASGIPDFRSPNSGMWEKDDPAQVASIWAFRLNPRSFYDWIRPMADLLLNASPNPAHFALAELQDRGFLKTIITQNIDNLHQRAGSRRVLELHGHMRQATCVRCYKEVAISAKVENQVIEGEIPYCECGGVLKPNVILFGEQLPVRVLNEAMSEARNCDLILVAGSSLTVTPAADIPFLAVDSGAKAVIVNFQPTSLDSRADVVIHGDIGRFLPRMVAALELD